MKRNKSHKRKTEVAVSLAGRSRLVAAFLAIAFGSFGLHKFYLGKVLLGLIYLFFFWSFLSGILGVIEGIMYLSMSDQEFQKRYS